MKKNQLFTVIIAFVGIAVLHSCKKEQTSGLSEVETATGPKNYVSQFKGAKRFPNNPIQVNVHDMNTLADILNQKKQNTVDVLRDSAWASGDGRTLFLQSSEMPAVLESTRRQLYLGAIIKGENAANVTDLRPVLFSVAERNPITVYASFPTDSISRSVAAPSPAADRNYLQSALKVGSGKQLASFRYEMESFKRYEELKLSFGADISVAGLFKLSFSDSTSFNDTKTRVRAEFTQENFSINIEPPIYEPFLKSPVDMSKLGSYDPLIVSSITYGTKGIITIESDSSYKSVTTAIKAVFNLPLPILKDSALTVNAGLTRAQIDVINTSKISIYVIGAQGKDLIKIVQGLPGFAQIIAGGGEFSWEAPGVPLYYTLNYLSDFGTYWNRFQVKVHNN